MKLSTAIIAFATLMPLATDASDREEKEKALAKDIGDLRIADGIVDVYKATNGQVTVYVGGRGSATANLVKISKVKAEDHALRIAEAASSKAFAEFIQKNVDACLGVQDTITDSSMNLDDIIQRMNSVTANETLAKNLRPEDRAAIMKAVLDQVIGYIRASSSVQSVTRLEVRQRAMQMIRGMTLFGSNCGRDGDELVAVKVYKWSPNSARFAAEAEGLNKQKARQPIKAGEKLSAEAERSRLKAGAFISHADDF